MDGAVKYVKGDATAGLLITLVNIVGGIAMGMLRQGLDINAALAKYTILTIGDGLVSQIPSLLISLATGILVTKGSKEADFGSVLIRQLFGIPKGIQEAQVVILVKEGSGIMLAVDVDKLNAQSAKDRHIDQAAVDTADILAVQMDLPGNHRLRVIRNTVFPEPL